MAKGAVGTREARRARRAPRSGHGRVMWKGTLQLGRVQVPVKLYAAVEERGVHFRLLHARDGVPVRQRMVDPVTHEEVSAAETRRAVELEPGVFVMLRPRELDAGGIRPSRAIEILRFVPAEALDPAWYERPYFLGPDRSASSYAALRAALHDRKLLGIARWVMRGELYLGALEARATHLALISLRFAEEVVPAARIEVAPGKAVGAAERALAEQLVEALEGRFDPSALQDEYRERVLALVAAKARGRRLRVATERAPKPSKDLARALQRSLRAVKGTRHAA